MSASPKQQMSVDEYLAFEATAETKHEFVNGEVIAMAGASPEHSVIREALSRAVGNALAAAGKRCITFSPDTRVRIDETGLYAYPDMTVVCGKPEFDATRHPSSLLNPLVVFEVISDSTGTYDRGAKAAHYRSRASLRELVLVSSTERSVEVLERHPEGYWKSFLFQGDATVPLTSLGIEITLTAIYEQLALL